MVAEATVTIKDPAVASTGRPIINKITLLLVVVRITLLNRLVTGRERPPRLTVIPTGPHFLLITPLAIHLKDSTHNPTSLTLIPISLLVRRTALCTVKRLMNTRNLRSNGLIRISHSLPIQAVVGAAGIRVIEVVLSAAPTLPHTINQHLSHSHHMGIPRLLPHRFLELPQLIMDQAIEVMVVAVILTPTEELM